MKQAMVLDARGNRLSPCSAEKARRLVRCGKAELVTECPLVIRLPYGVEIPKAQGEHTPARGQRILVHICCAPCATYTVNRLREMGFVVTGHWFNPNIHPHSEHERRRETLARYADQIELPVIWEPGYEMVAFLRAVAGHEDYGERCSICYRLRLERTASVAGKRVFDAITTTLLISPYQNQAAIRRIGGELASFENFRRGFAEHYRLSREYNLYMQRYCGCVYSEWEARDPQASTRPRGSGQRLIPKRDG